MHRRTVLGGALAWGTALNARALVAQPVLPPMRVGILEDMSGPYSDLGGRGSLIAAQMAVKDFGGTVLGRPVEVLSADHQNKADIGSAIARRWFDQDGVAMIAGLGNSSVSIAVQQIAREKNRIDIVTGGGSSVLTGKFCSPTGIHWTTDTYACAKAAATALVGQGLKSWFFLTSDYAAGHAFEETGTEAVKALGGTVLGHAVHPFGTADFSSYLLSAQSSGAQVVALANAGADTINVIEQAHEFGLTPRQALAALYLDALDVRSIGLDKAQGTRMTVPFYWDMDEQARAWSKRFREQHGAPPSQSQAGTYGAVLHYLRAAQAAGTDTAIEVVAGMKAMPVEDFFTHGAQIRADGRVMRPMYAYAVKAAAESKGPLDLLSLVRELPASEAFRPPAPAECPLAAG